MTQYLGILQHVLLLWIYGLRVNRGDAAKHLALRSPRKWPAPRKSSLIGKY